MANFKLWTLRVEETCFIAVLEEVNCEKALLTMFFQLLTEAGMVRTMLRAQYIESKGSVLPCFTHVR